MKGTSKSLIELEYLFEEVCKATTNHLDWINPEGQQYPHDLRKPLPLIPNTRGRRVIPFDHFINNDLEYLSGGVSSRRYATFVTKAKVADYGHIKWIEDLVPNRMWSQVLESARDVYSKRRIIAVTKLEIVKWHNYKHLDWITVRKLTNLTVKERLAFNVSLRMFTRSVVIQRRVEDLQLGVESYQKKLNLTKQDTYRPDFKRSEAYTAYSNPRGFIYQNKDKKNRLMRIDELHKFSDGTLNGVRTALNDRLKGIRMQYLPHTIWRQSDKDKAGAMIQAIDKQLKTRRIMRSLERFVGRRPYEERFYTSAGNPVKEILLKLNLPDHRILKDGGEGQGHDVHGGVSSFRVAFSFSFIFLLLVVMGITLIDCDGVDRTVSPRLFCSGLKVYHLPPASSVALEQDELSSSVGLDFRARLGGSQMYSGHLESNASSVGVDFQARLNGGRMYSGHLDAKRLPSLA
ncbi:hypothetical protein Tco_0139543 [Tanacetum coccineum]